MNGVQAIYVRRRLNPDRALVWFVGRTDEERLETIALEVLPEGLPYMVPSWWISTWGPFTKEEADAIVAGRKQPDRRWVPPPEERPDEPPDMQEFRRRLSESPALRERFLEIIRPTSAGPRGRRGQFPTSWQEASRRWTRRRAIRGHVKLAPHTWLEHHPGPASTIFCIRLHRTEIVCFYENGAIELNSGGWRTPTTKDRINRALPDGYKIWSRRLGSGRRRTSEWWLYEWSRGQNQMVPVLEFRENMAFIPGPNGLRLIQEGR